MTNLQGDVIALLDETGTPAFTYTYDAWGNVQITQNHQLAEFNPLLYRGYVYDFETGLYYLQSRYYNPEWGRFINADAYAATGQGLVGNNTFAYCLNNPVSRVDTSGQASALFIAVGKACIRGPCSPLTESLWGLYFAFTIMISP